MPQIPQGVATNDASENYLTGNGDEIIGFGNDGGITYEEPDAKAQMAMGIDGKVVVSRKRGRRPRVAVITLKAASLGYARYCRMFDIQDTQSKILPMPYVHFNANTGTTVTSTHMVFLDEPIDPMQANDPEVTVRIGLPIAVVQRATAIVLP